MDAHTYICIYTSTHTHTHTHLNKREEHESYPQNNIEARGHSSKVFEVLPGRCFTDVIQTDNGYSGGRDMDMAVIAHTVLEGPPPQETCAITNRALSDSANSYRGPRQSQG